MTEIDVTELARRLDEVAVVDVRSPAEYNGTIGNHCDPRRGHIAGASNLDVQELLHLAPAAIRERLGLPEGAEVVVYCHSGSRSAYAAQLLRELGYEARNYTGSWHEWSRTDLPIAP